YLRERWDAGCRNIAVLWREVRAQGYAGGYSALYAHLVRWRDQASSTARSPSSSPRRFSVRQATWLEAAERSDLPELRGVAAGLRRAWAAVAAGLDLPWSSGQTEGQVNRLKLLKRQMFGRAGFDLLRRRLLLASCEPGPWPLVSHVGRGVVEVQA